MTRFFVLYKKDFRQLFFSVTGFLSILLFPLILSIWMFFVVHIFSSTQADLSPYFAVYSSLIILFVPVLTLKLWIDDNKFRTGELIMTLPYSEAGIILARFLAVLSVFSIIYTGSLLFSFTIYPLGNFDSGKILTNYLALFLNGMASIAICIFISTMASGGIISWIISTALLFFLGSSTMFFSYAPHMESFSRGLFSFSDLLYFAAVTIFSLIFSMKITLVRRWR